MKKLIFIFLFPLPLISLAQNNAADVLNAEKSFAAYAVQHGTKAAFLRFADSIGLVFENGKAVNAIQTWAAREDRPGVLNWYPVYGFTSTSGDMGFTTGPWTFQPKSVDDSIVARGQFNTVWHKNATGEWRFLLDMGISRTPSFETTTFSFSDKKTDFMPGKSADLLQAEEAFIRQTEKPADRLNAYTASVSRTAFFLGRNGELPATSEKAILQLVNKMPQAIEYTTIGSGIARSGDLGYVYGTTLINGKEDSYLRIWQRENKEWKLALEVVQY